MNDDYFKAFNYDELSHLQIGKLCEYWVKMFLTLEGFDIYTTEVDNKGIDLVIRLNGAIHIDIQVKSVRLKTTNYAFITKTKTVWSDIDVKRPNLYLALIVIKDLNPPSAYLIPASSWLFPNALLCNREYGESLKSKPEWGVKLSKKNLELLNQYKLKDQAIIIRQLNNVETSETTL